MRNTSSEELCQGGHNISQDRAYFHCGSFDDTENKCKDCKPGKRQIFPHSRSLILPCSAVKNIQITAKNRKVTENVFQTQVTFQRSHRIAHVYVNATNNTKFISSMNYDVSPGSRTAKSLKSRDRKMRTYNASFFCG